MYFLGTFNDVTRKNCMMRFPRSSTEPCTKDPWTTQGSIIFLFFRGLPYSLLGIFTLCYVKGVEHLEVSECSPCFGPRTKPCLFTSKLLSSECDDSRTRKWETISQKVDSVDMYYSTSNWRARPTTVLSLWDSIFIRDTDTPVSSRKRTLTIDELELENCF